MRDIRGALIASLALAAGFGGVPAVAEPVRAHTDTGEVIGQAANGAAVFKGIPYAAPPVGPLRWAPTARPTPWARPRAADAFGPGCPQPAGPAGHPNSGGWVGATSEDCLYLNVWSPAAAVKAGPRAKAPVMVWLHGGGDTTGAGSLGAYDGSAFVRDGVVLVTLNYRLGALGFFAHPALTRAAAADEPLINYGLMDQIAALRWVRRNIAAFGGDPDAVTLFGESAGGEDALALMTSDYATGLFARVIVESGLGWQAPVSLADQEKRGAAVATRAGAPAGATLDQLRALPADALGALAGYQAGPAIDGHILKQSTAQAFAEGHFLHVPLVIGTNSFEASLLTSLRLPPTAYLAAAPAAARPAYADLPDDAARGRAMFTDAVMGAPARWIAGRAHGGPAWLYQFAFTPTALKGVAPGPGHAGEIPFVFDSWSTMGPEGEGLKPGPDDVAVTRMVHGCWVAFAKTGVPTCPGAPAWPPYSDRYDTLLRFDRSASLETHFRMPQYAALQAAILPTLQLPKVAPDPAPPPLPREAD